MSQSFTLKEWDFLHIHWFHWLYLGLNYRTMYQIIKLCDKWVLQAYYGYLTFFLLTSPFLPRPIFRCWISEIESLCQMTTKCLFPFTNFYQTNHSNPKMSSFSDFLQYDSIMPLVVWFGKGGVTPLFYKYLYPYTNGFEVLAKHWDLPSLDPLGIF